MKNNNGITLLRTFLKSNSAFNLLRYSKDSKKKSKVIGGLVGYVIIYATLLFLCIIAAIGYGYMGIAPKLPSLTVCAVVVMSLIFTLLRTNSYLFNFKEYDMIMSMPFSAETVVACKFLYMYIKSFPTYGLISFALMIGYGAYEKPAFYVYLMWILLTLLIPLIPMVIASALGVLVAKISGGFKFKKIIQVIFTFIFIFLCISLRFIIEYLARNSDTSDVINAVSDKMDSFATVYFPAIWFEKAIVNRSFLMFLAFIIISVAVFVVFFKITARYYIKINSRLGSHEKSKKGKAVGFRSKSLVNTIAFKEWKRFTGSISYLTNAGFGVVLVVVLSIAAFFFDADKLVGQIFEGTPFTSDMMAALVSIMVYMFLGMVATTCITPSLEGKNYWIVQSLPIDQKKLYQGKMLFNLYLYVPCGLLASIAIAKCFGVSFVCFIAMLLSQIALILFSTTFGMICGIKFMKLEWENDVEIVKQSTAVLVYLFPNMIFTFALMGLRVAVMNVMSSAAYLFLVAAFAFVLAGICYEIVVKRMAR